jgi:hypothetical protein
MSDQPLTQIAKKVLAAASYSSENRQVKGIAERPRPANTGWCGAEGCKHLSHKHFSSPAKPVK